MIDEKKLIEEIEKLKSNLIHGACSSQVAMETRCKEEAYNEVLAILDSEQEEPVSEDLEEVSKKYSSCIYLEEVLSDGDKEVLKERLINTFKAGAKWMHKKMIHKFNLKEE